MHVHVCVFTLQREEEYRKHVQQEKEKYRLNLWAFIAKKEIPKVSYCTSLWKILVNVGLDPVVSFKSGGEPVV